MIAGRVYTINVDSEQAPMPLDLFSRHYGHGFDNEEPLIVLHGLFGSSSNWNTIARDLSLRRPVVSLDLRNHGRSPHAPDMDYPAMAEDVEQFFRRHDIAHACVMGHSMGGKVAMQLALDNPTLVSRLIVVDIAPVNYTHDYGPVIAAMRRIQDMHIRQRDEADAVLAETVPEAQVRGFLLQNLVHGKDGYRWRVNLDAMENHLQSITGFPDARGRIWNGPALFVRGAQSDFVTEDNRQAIASLFPKYSLVTVANAGHWLHAENTPGFLAGISEFLD